MGLDGLGNVAVAPPTWVVVAAIVLFGAGVLYLAYRADKKKHERLKAFAASVGWTYEVSIPTLRAQWRGAPFNIGYSRYSSQFLIGDFRGRQVRVFEHHYTTGFGKSRKTWTVMVTMVSLPGWLPDLELTGENLTTRVAKALGGQDIQFESEEFNRRWRVEAVARKTAHDIIHPRFMEFMVAGPQDPIRFEGTDVWTWHQGEIVTDAIHSRLTRLVQAVDLIPRHVWQDYGRDPVNQESGST